ncbi:hypothetical protein [Acidiphilium sp. PM]|uniref:hypothetical protein n=1 Tax=Acidiphilium sp. PM TaxID=1043206 RepID=UPI00021447E1|nr:hypothetical protein [Acidiphilium sp. PM]EGO95078.1 hypothetical protein APM_2099 [Acidiphilium sp. PM]
MTYSQIPPTPETPSRIVAVMAALAVIALSGCAAYSPAALLHRYEGGVISSGPPPAPGLDSPWPNLASVPPRPTSISPADQAALRGRLEAANRGQNLMAGHEPPAPAAAPAAAFRAAAASRLPAARSRAVAGADRAAGRVRGAPRRAPHCRNRVRARA